MNQKSFKCFIFVGSLHYLVLIYATCRSKVRVKQVKKKVTPSKSYTLHNQSVCGVILPYNTITGSSKVCNLH